MPAACQDWASTMAAYRFFSNPRVDESVILAGYVAATRSRIAATKGSVLILHDTTEFSYRRDNPQTIGKTHVTYCARKRPSMISPSACSCTQFGIDTGGETSWVNCSQILDAKKSSRELCYCIEKSTSHESQLNERRTFAGWKISNNQRNAQPPRAACTSAIARATFTNFSVSPSCWKLISWSALAMTAWPYAYRSQDSLRALVPP